TPSFSKPMRIQGSFVTEKEIEKVIDFTKEQEKPEYKPEILETSTSKFGHTDFDDEFFEEAVEMVLRYKSASVSFLQRKLRIGYSRAARIMDIMEDRGIITPLEGSKSRKVLITEEDWENIKHKGKIDKQV
ncbi:MAG: hypothetical protein KAS39_00170, partial [Actinomycetia bacterium]|nr:hypothetical protein [Actinomycetes bacterium]